MSIIFPKIEYSLALEKTAINKHLRDKHLKYIVTDLWHKLHNFLSRHEAKYNNLRQKQFFKVKHLRTNSKRAKPRDFCVQIVLNMKCCVYLFSSL